MSENKLKKKKTKSLKRKKDQKHDTKIEKLHEHIAYHVNLDKNITDCDVVVNSRDQPFMISS